MRPKLQPLATKAALLLLFAAALPLVAAHGDDSSSVDMSMGMSMDGSATNDASSSSAMSNTTAAAAVEPPLEETYPTFFYHPTQTGWLYAHIGLMVASWAVVLPPAIMLSIARSRFHLPVQVLFHIVNGIGMFTGFVYRHSTPDLYPNNSHVPLGWVATALTVFWSLTSLVVAYSDYCNSSSSKQGSSEGAAGAGGMGSGPWARGRSSFERMHPFRYRDRFSGDSGQGMSLLGGSTRQNSADSTMYNSKHAEAGDMSPTSDNGGSERGFERARAQAQSQAEEGARRTSAYLDQQEEEDEYDGETARARADAERRGFLGHNRIDRYLSTRVSRFASQRLTRSVRFLQIVTEKFLLLLGFAAICTGVVVWGGLFMKREVFSGLAHFIKGGIFFWYGLLTLGRWMGAFAEFGWAWNLRPLPPAVARWKARVPSAEFTESFVIWLYGVSNVGLEHLNNWGKGWSPQDLEHVSITLLFFGGGLMGMLVETRWLRDLLDVNVVQQQQRGLEFSGAVAGDASASSDRDAEAAAGAVSPTTTTPMPLSPTSPESNNTRNSYNKNENSSWSHHPSARTPLNPFPALTILLLGIMMSSHHQTSMTSTMLHAQWGTLFMGFAFSRAATYILLFLRPPQQHFPARPPTELVAAFCLISGGIMFMSSARDCVRGFESVGIEAMPVLTVVMGLTGCVMAWEVLSFALKGWAVRRERLG